MIRDQRSNYRLKVLIEADNTSGDSWSYSPIAKSERCFSGKLDAKVVSAKASTIMIAALDEFSVLMQEHIDYLIEEEARLQAKIDANESC